MVTARTTTLVAAAGSALVAVGLLSTNTTGARGIAAGLTFYAGVVGLLVAAVFTVRDRRRILAGTLPRVGFLLVAAGLLAFLAGVALAVQGTLEPTPCDDMGTCIPPNSEEARTLGTVAAVLLLGGTAVLLVQGLAGPGAGARPADA